MASSNSHTLAEIAAYLGAELQGDGSCEIRNIATLQSAGEGDISFLANPTYKKYLPDTKASAVIISPDLVELCSVNAVVLENPYLGYAKLTHLFETRPATASGIHPSAVVDPGARVDESATVGANTVIAAGAVVGAGAEIGAGCFIGENSSIGDNTRLYPNVSVYHGVRIGQSVIIHSSTVIGSDGFGFANDGGQWQKIVQLGGVTIGNGVEIGACTTIDRGAIDDTVIEDGAKLDNHIQIAHNVHIGMGTVMAGCSAVAGSTKIGKFCIIGGRASIAGHVEIADFVHMTGGAEVSRSISKAGLYSSGTGLDTNRSWRKNVVRFRQLDEIARRLRVIEKKFEDQV